LGVLVKDAELQKFILHAIIVAGKNAPFANRAYKQFIGDVTIPPFEYIRLLVASNTLEKRVKEAKTGNYTKIVKAFSQLASSNLNLATCTASDLEQINGIGPKTSRYFLMYTRAEPNCAALDRHILRWLKDLGHKDVPKGTPTAKAYGAWEQIFLEEAKRHGMTAREADTFAWNKYSRNTDEARERALQTTVKADSL
jgi:hypothetical protein